jgi:DNA mismatch endonuclease (patch repair protein)
LVLPSLRRRADIVFPTARVAVFVDGCFWHGCPEHCVWPKANASWWKEKIRMTQLRDADTDVRLEVEGWLIVRVWEHELAEGVADRIEVLVKHRVQQSSIARRRAN